MAQMATADINDLPDSAFAYIAPGGTKDASGKTTPRDLRHFPIHDKAHADNAAARIAQGAKFGKEALPKVKAAQKKFGESPGSSSNGPSRAEYMRFYLVEDMHILRTAEGSSSGRVVEAFAAVFEQPAEIQDFQGHYNEVIDRSAFSRAIDHVERQRGGLANVKVLYNHGMTVGGTPSERYSMPLGVPVLIRAEERGLLTRTEYAETPLADEVLAHVRAGTINAQSFTGKIWSSSPELRRGAQYRPGAAGELPTVRRTRLGLREYGPVLWPAYDGAEILGVRMSTPGSWSPDQDEEAGTPPDEGPATGDQPAPTEDGEHSARYHQHALYRMNSEEKRKAAGLVW